MDKSKQHITLDKDITENKYYAVIMSLKSQLHQLIALNDFYKSTNDSQEQASKELIEIHKDAIDVLQYNGRD